MENEAEPLSIAKKSCSFPIKIKYFSLLVIIAILFWTFTSTEYKATYSLNKLKESFKDANFMQFLENIYSAFNETNNKTETTNGDCKPTFTNVKQYSVLIDGIQYPTQTPLHKNVSINFQCLDKNPNKKIILFYNSWFGNEAFSIGTGYRGPFESSGCPVTSCETTNDKKRLNESDFVITHMRDTIPPFPSFRPKNQRWVFLLYVIIILNISSLLDIFWFKNWTILIL
jgi:hypothetical protein